MQALPGEDLCAESEEPMEDEELEPVNCAVAVRAIKDAGIFMLLDRDGCHYLVTEEFILQLRKKDAWKIQCKTETERRNVYYVKKKGGWEESPKIANPDAVLVRYESYISQAANRGEPLAATGITITSHEGIQMAGVLYAGETGYALVNGEHLAMLLGKIYLQRVGDAVVANGTQVLSLMQDTAWKENSFIVQEEGKE
jgi:hypothetical protein